MNDIDDYFGADPNSADAGREAFTAEVEAEVKDLAGRVARWIFGDRVFGVQQTTAPTSQVTSTQGSEVNSLPPGNTWVSDATGPGMVEQIKSFQGRPTVFPTSTPKELLTPEETRKVKGMKKAYEVQKGNTQGNPFPSFGNNSVFSSSSTTPGIGVGNNTIGGYIGGASTAAVVVPVVGATVLVAACAACAYWFFKAKDTTNPKLDSKAPVLDPQSAGMSLLNLGSTDV